MTDESQAITVQEQPRARAQITAGGQVGALVPQSLEEAYRLADAMSRSGMTPNSIKTPEAVLVAIMAGAELGMAPFQSLQSFAVINGRPGLWGDAIPALLLANGFKLVERFDNEATDYPDNMRAVCEITRPDGQVIVGDFSVFDAKEAGLWSKAGPWQTAKKRMLKMRARSFAARDGAADVLRGLFVAEEAQDFTPIRDDGPTGMLEKLKANAAPVDAEGFNVNRITDATGEQHAKPKRATKKKPDLGEEMLDAIAEVEPELVEQVREDHGADLDTVLDGDNIPQTQGADSPAPTVEADKGSSGSATDVPSNSAEEASGQIESAEPSQSGEPKPLEGEIVYDGHPIAQEAAPEAEVEPEATDVTSEPPPGPFADFWAVVQTTEAWSGIPSALGILFKTDDWKSLSEDEQNAFRAKTWTRLAERNVTVDPESTPTAFGMWMCTKVGQQGAADIEGGLAVLRTQATYGKMTPEVAAGFEQRATNIINKLRGS